MIGTVLDVFGRWVWVGLLMLVPVIVMNTAPVARGESYVITEDMQLSVSAPGLLANDNDPDGDPLTVSLEYGPDQGSLSLATNGAFVYTPTLNYWGEDQFRYIVSDGELTARATANIQIIDFIDPPVVDAGPDKTVDEGSPVTFVGSFSFDSLDTHRPQDANSIIWYFGDGNQASGSLSVTHTYAESGIYTATLYVLALQEFPGSDSLVVTVLNVAPVVAAGEDGEVLPRQAFTRSGSFTDPGRDIWTAKVDYGDGMSPQGLLLNGQDFTLDHTFRVPGVYLVSVNVSDDDGGVGMDSFMVTVGAFPLFLPVVLRE